MKLSDRIAALEAAVGSDERIERDLEVIGRFLTKAEAAVVRAAKRNGHITGLRSYGEERAA